MLTGVKPVKANVKPVMSVAMQQRWQALRCSVRLWIIKCIYTRYFVHENLYNTSPKIALEVNWTKLSTIGRILHLFLKTNQEICN